jgi:hypothetical protein
VVERLTRQPFERGRVVVVRFPLAEVADVTLAPDVCSPRLVGAEARFVDSDGKEHAALVAPLALECRLDFRLHPVAGNGVG